RAFLGAPRDRHPVEIGHIVEKHLRAMAVGWHVVRKLPEPIPILAVLVVASAFDAALHDAYGRMLSLNCYRTYGPEFLETDLGEFLGKEFAGETLDRYVLPAPKPTM